MGATIDSTMLDELIIPMTNVKGIIVAAALLYLVKYILTIIHRLCFSPLASFPGPKLAAATSLYETYFDLIKRGKFYLEIQRMHEVYGPIVRINPHELSINDPSYYDSVYVSGGVRPTEVYDKALGGGLGIEHTFFSTVDHDLHRQRRKPIEPYFSRNGTFRLEPLLRDCTRRLRKRFDSFRGTGRVVNIDHVVSAYTGDVMRHVCVDEPDYFLDEEGFAPEWHEMHHNTVLNVPLMTAAPWLIHIALLIPDSVLLWLSPATKKFFDFRNEAAKHIIEVKSEAAQLEKSSSPSSQNPFLSTRKTTLFRYLIHESKLPPSELDTERMKKEALILFGAGTATTGRVSSIVVYHLAANPSMRRRLEDELSTVDLSFLQDSSPPSSYSSSSSSSTQPSIWTQLEKLPYLQSIIQEGIRLSYGSMRRLPRVSPKVALEYTPPSSDQKKGGNKTWIIPPGTPVGMNAYYQHTDPSAFPDPFEFIPERWLPHFSSPSSSSEEEEMKEKMKRNFIPFSRGSRGCPGSSLAYAELSYLLAGLFSPGSSPFVPFETDRGDIDAVHDFIMPLPRLESNGVRVIFD